MTAERRLYPRSEFSWPVTIETTELSMHGITKNISTYGAFIYCEKPLTPDETFDMVINIQERGNSFKGKAKVVWSDLHGMGVTFNPESN